ncbi:MULTISPECIES: monovalent cation/H(+) antiporter subunit G [Exiguobacterium]|uniref:Monovalent cation/proton antiporter, MnhG/PhaG subunit n=1 Tax=Exiguobacterium sibiricum (strain DSM 17290 / CCUG 55495 / CIP 109462 / JCM 13490 / 255-15) TaxID=262543 RepID=B1YHI2_EXIS2|nr:MULTISPECIES: monovalent cation/H(+) antiporter subunit G [Exiguobacterium]ACB61155.1 monovalent cation/proton antiporter, MnhG/PhaG subunit [Exiguobacterium sibiricum 255-15]MCT4792777.1 monovalent cation/H(+) antiporter subunit G [Exiguobacterium artemiae]MDW2886074.1 monovalent cation/H(+) antiporter subunit G [Exiguobacterium sibiricum]
MTAISDFFVAAFALIGAFFSLVTALGLIRLPDLYTRAHAASKSATLGVMSILISVIIYFVAEDGFFSSRVVLGILFVLITAPIGGHLIARAAYYSDVPLWKGSVQDDLAKNPEHVTPKKRPAPKLK